MYDTWRRENEGNSFKEKIFEKEIDFGSWMRLKKEERGRERGREEESRHGQSDAIDWPNFRTGWSLGQPL